MSDTTLTVILHCTNLPGTVVDERQQVRLGIQQGKEVIEDVPADRAEVLFQVPVRVVRKADWDFGGPFVQGKLGERFIYLCWGERHGGMWDGVGRTKVALWTVDTALITKAVQMGQPLKADILLTDAKGRPAYATLKEQYIHWSVADAAKADRQTEV